MWIVALLAAIVLSYLLGSINWAIIISKAMTHKDVRDAGSGNAGMTNVLRTAGKTAGILTLIGDIAKGVAAVAIGRYFLFPYIYDHTGSEWLAPVYGVFYCGIACMLGHIFPVFFGFRGGKAVAATVGVTLIIDWRITLCAVLVFLIFFLFSQIVSVSSIFAAASVTLFVFLYYPLWGYAPEGNRLVLTLFAAVLSLIIIVKHRSNVIRLIHGEEKKITFK